MTSSHLRLGTLLLVFLTPLALAAGPVVFAAPASASTHCGPTNSSASSTGVTHSAGASVTGQLGGNSTSGPTFSRADAYGTGIGSSASASGDSILWTAHSDCTFPAPPSGNAVPGIDLGCDETGVGASDDVDYDGAIYESPSTDTYWWQGTATSGGHSESRAYPAFGGLTFTRSVKPSAEAPQDLVGTPLVVRAHFLHDGSSVLSCLATAEYANN